MVASARRPRISHLFFANDSLVFRRATVSEATEIQRILKVYELSSGQQLNCPKTSPYFSPNTDIGTKERVKSMFGAQVIKPHESYLGSPSLVGRSKNNTFAQPKQKVANKVSSWKEKLLTYAGKEILIKSVAQAMPAYSMSCFLLPNKLCEELIGMIKQFWWEQMKNEKKTGLAKLGQDVLVEGKRRAGFLRLKKLQPGSFG